MLRALGTGIHIAVDKETNGILPGGDLLVGVTFFPFIVTSAMQFSMQRFIDLVVFAVGTAYLALGPTTRNCRRSSRLGASTRRSIKIIFQVRIVGKDILANSTADWRCRTWPLGTLFTRTAAPAATTATTARPAIFVIFQMASTSGMLFHNDIVVFRNRFWRELVIDEFFWCRGKIKIFAVRSMQRLWARCLSFIAATTTPAATAAAAMFATFTLVARAIKSQAIICGGRIDRFARSGHEIIKVISFADRLGM